MNLKIAFLYEITVEGKGLSEILLKVTRDFIKVQARTLAPVGECYE